jgi:hypothetical protein
MSLAAIDVTALSLHFSKMVFEELGWAMRAVIRMQPTLARMESDIFVTRKIRWVG